MNPTITIDFFDTLAKVLLRCWIFGFLLLFIWLGVFVAAGDAVYRSQSAWFDISRHEMDLIFYGGIGLAKLIVLLFFFFPWLAIRLVLRKTQKIY